MGVTLQLILGLLLALSQSSFAKSPNLRQIREAPPPTPSLQNVTEINNRDLNKIIKTNPKTEALDSKAKLINNVHSYEELPLKLTSNEEEGRGRKKNNETEKSEEELKRETAKLAKEKLREENSRAIGVDSSKFWPVDFHSKSTFTLPPTPDLVKFHEPTDFNFEGTRHPSFESNSELTTPSTKFFDKKFKETVESVEQNIEDDVQDEHRDVGSEEDNDEDIKDLDLKLDDFIKAGKNESVEYVKTKTIVNNETIDKNSIHKGVNVEQTKKLSYGTVFNDTKVYDEDKTSKSGTSELITTERVSTSSSTTTFAPATTTATTRKSSLLKESLNEKTNSHLLNNKIETETKEPIKIVDTSTASSIIKKDWDTKIGLTSSEKPTNESLDTIPSITITTTAATTTTTLSSLPVNISLQENIIPLHFGSESTPIQESSSERPPTNENLTHTVNETSEKTNRTIKSRITVNNTTEIYSTTEINTSTILPETTTSLDLNREQSDGTTTDSLLETTTFTKEEPTTGSLDGDTEKTDSTEEGTTIILDKITTENSQRTSKSLEPSIVTEHMLIINDTTAENSTKDIVASTDSTIRNELDSTTLNDGEKTESAATDNVVEKDRDLEGTTVTADEPTNTMVVDQTTTMKQSSEFAPVQVSTQKDSVEAETTTEAKTVANMTEKVIEALLTTTEAKSTTQTKELPITTTEFAFVHIEKDENSHTTQLPEILSPSMNYSTTASSGNTGNKFRNIVADKSDPRVTGLSSSTLTSTTTTTSTTSTSPSTSTTTTTSTTEDSNATTEDNTESPTEDSFSTNSGGGKGKIAAIVISTVGAVCLVLLAGLLYVMKKRQKRLNYGPRCRPVNLDDYSIDNLSVYNSVRRKGGARLSKRSFGNPAFDDPVAPTHPLNFPALANFSTNLEDIKAEFEEIPQISARTSELPEGCETKNRYANVIPLPETRVFLKSIDGYPNSDYINANYVTGPKNTKGYYIATQGPMQNTVDDFWRMVWEQQVKVILMLTRLVENGLEKCVDYLPESEVIDCSRLFGDFQIILKKQEVKDKYIISTLQLKNMVSNSWREVTHFWYLGWPEKGIPSEANSLIAFLIEARSYMKTATIDKRDGVNGVQNGGAHNEHNPVVVHCSPGTGRTGVAIACDIAIREFETSRLVDIPKIVYRIRRDRASAVQTKEQYTFIYKVVSLYATKLTGGALENF